MRIVNLLCKGQSLRYFNELPKSEFVVLANDFDGEISQIKPISDYLKKQTIHQVLNMVFGDNGVKHDVNDKYRNARSKMDATAGEALL